MKKKNTSAKKKIPNFYFNKLKNRKIKKIYLEFKKNINEFSNKKGKRIRNRMGSRKGRSPFKNKFQIKVNKKISKIWKTKEQVDLLKVFYFFIFVARIYL